MSNLRLESIKATSLDYEDKVKRAAKRLKKLESEQSGIDRSEGAGGGLEAADLEGFGPPSSGGLQTGEFIDESAIDRAAERVALGEEESFGGDFDATMALEAIIEAESRPPFFISDDKIITNEQWGIVNSFDFPEFLTSEKLDAYEKQALKVGAVDLVNHRGHPYCGTGWMVTENIAVTNRHVADKFAQPAFPSGWKFKKVSSLTRVEARLNHQRQRGITSESGRRAEVLDILYIANSNEPDFAFLRVRPCDAGPVEPFEFFDGKVLPEMKVGIVGYPMGDNRNDARVKHELFGGVYGVKRFSPGIVMTEINDITILHDCTTLGGSSGSPLFDLESGKAIGLHFSGLENINNGAVRGDIVKAALQRISGAWAPGAQLEAAAEGPVRKLSSLKNRSGYDPEFLGEGNLTVTLPDFGDHNADRSKLIDKDEFELKYQHFSVVQSSPRKLAMITAVNIDGKRLKRIPKSNSWYFDPRIPLEDQSGNELYRETQVDNPLDRGHLVRRLDPSWGGKSTAKRAQKDTYHYTNSAPQHLGLNRRHWVGLEDYILDSLEDGDLKVSVFTGPVFRDDDPKLSSGASAVKIPKEYWKIAFVVNADTGKLSASGYVLSQGDMLRGFTEAAFIFGAYETYQVPISLIEKHTGYDFGVLNDADSMKDVDRNESMFASVFKRINGQDDISF